LRGIGFFSELDMEANGKPVDPKACSGKAFQRLIIVSNMLAIFKRPNLRKTKNDIERRRPLTLDDPAHIENKIKHQIDSY